MPRKILLTELQYLPAAELDAQCDVLPDDPGQYSTECPDFLSYAEILRSVIKQFPHKMLFSIQEAANALSVSIEFLRKKINDGVIVSVSMGDRKMISINELTKIIHKGV